jgi:hypothetical protein
MQTKDGMFTDKTQSKSLNRSAHPTTHTFPFIMMVNF